MIDFRDTVFDVCIVGAGPAGLALAQSTARSGLQVLLVERGAFSAQVGVADFCNETVLTPSTHSPLIDSIDTGLGGTSRLWGGRCVPFDDYDFQKRPFAPETSWPIAHSEVKPFYAAAADFLGIGDPDFTVGASSLSLLPARLAEQFDNSDELKCSAMERWCPVADIWRVNRGVIQALEGCTILTGYYCTNLIQHESSNAVVAAKLVSITDSTQLIEVRARQFVLAAGGIETTRLVLASMEEPNGIRPAGAAHVGMGYMGHPSGKISDIQLFGDPDQTIYHFEHHRGVYLRRRISFADNVMAENELGNIVFWLDNPKLSDASHKSGVLSAAYLALKMPVLGALLAPNAIRQRLTHNSSEASWLDHFLNCVLSPLDTISFCFSFLYKRYFAATRVPGFFVKSASNKYALHFHAEQFPNANNFIALNGQTNRYGVPEVDIALNWNQRDIDSVLKAHEKLDELLQKHNIGKLVYTVPAENRAAEIASDSIDGYHQMGTLKMAATAKGGVTDENGKVFGLDNLYIASSAIFPSSGQANPTFLLVALAFRQAQHIKNLLKKEVVNA